MERMINDRLVWFLESNQLIAKFQAGFMGWSGGAKVSCILRHRGVQLILAYSWARPAILVAGKDRWGIFFISSVSSLSFLFLSSLSLSFISSTISSITFLPFSGR